MIQELLQNIGESIEVHERLASLACDDCTKCRHIGASLALRDVRLYISEVIAGRSINLIDRPH